MTTEYEPGRIYSGVLNAERGRELFIYTGSGLWLSAYNGGYRTTPHVPTDVRGPLVVLDLKYCTAVVGALREQGFDHAADLIDEQTRPRLQAGWHEVEVGDSLAVRRWDGQAWLFTDGTTDSYQDWTSTHYIGPGSDQS